MRRGKEDEEEKEIMMMMMMMMVVMIIIIIIIIIIIGLPYYRWKIYPVIPVGQTEVRKTEIFCGN